MATPSVPRSDHTASAPPAQFNSAAHLLAVNAQRHAKLAYIDDQQQSTYGELDLPVRLKLVDQEGATPAVGDIGELYISSPSAAHLYWNGPEKTRATFQGEWTKSGDKYRIDEDGRYVYAGRSDDMLKVSGIYVSPFEVEATLMQHSAVLEAAVVGKPDADGLTRTLAYVLLKTGQAATADELKAFVKDRLAPFKYPRQIKFLSELPKTAIGKIQRFRLRHLSSPVESIRIP